jgi:hypothetical protein
MSFNFDAPTWFMLIVRAGAGIEMSAVAFIGWRVINAGHRPRVVHAREEPIVASLPSVTSLRPYQEGRRRLVVQPTAQPGDYLPQPYVA